MAQIINLRMARKAKARADSSQTAEANRAKHGRTKAERSIAKAEAERITRIVDGARLNPEQDKD